MSHNHGCKSTVAAPVEAEKEMPLMVFAVIKLITQPNKRDELLEMLRYVKDRALDKAGCLGCGAYEATDGSTEILYEEQWRSTKDLDAHIRSGLYRSVLNAMELAREEPKISFHEVSQTKSMELIQELRGQ